MGEQNKRKRGPASNKQAKRRKGSQPAAAAKPKRAVDINALPWKTVDVTGMLDDAEGFYGLEEVEGVEIVRQGNTVQFMTAASPEPTVPDKEEFEGFDDAPDGTTEEKQEDAQPEAVAEGQTQTEAPRKNTKKDQTKKEKPKREQPKKEQTKKEQAKKDHPTKQAQKTAKAAESDPELETNVFSQIQDADEQAEELDMSEWVKLDLSPRLISSISRLKFSKPTPIQAQAIPHILQGHDVVGKASTGSGKTLAFGIPIVEEWLSQSDKKGQKEKAHHPIALIISPTRELAHQITTHIKEMCAGLPVGPYTCSVTGGLSVQKQQRQLTKADIVIGTPGRLWEVLSSDANLLNSFRRIRYLVVDEADRILTEGNFKEAEEIFEALDKVHTTDNEETEDAVDEEERERQSARDKRQTLVFSATFNKGLQQKLTGKARYNLLDEKQSMELLLKKLNFREEPEFVDVNPTSQMADRLKEGMIECGAMEKDLYLYSVLLMQLKMRTLVFTNSISTVRRLTPLMQNLNLPVLPLHSEMPQKARLRSVERFTASKAGTKGAASILIATDVAARGLDIPGIDLVVHYHVPRAADAYVHRSGRTARAESKGVSILLCSPEEVVSTRRLVAKVHSDSRRGKTVKEGFFIRTIDIDRKIVSRLRERVVLAKKISDAHLAKERGNKDDDWMKKAAEDLGVDYDSEDMEKASKWAGRGANRKEKEKEARNVTKAEIGAMKAELKQLLAKPVNVGVSEKYLGHLDVNEILRNGVHGEFLGQVDGLGLNDL